ncbi:MAG: hypothetical protein ABWY56_17120 [Propionibacteriaceae bacterium]
MLAPRLISARALAPRLVVVRLLSLLAAVTLALIGGAVFPSNAYACSCGGLGSGTAASRADAVFTGTVVDKQAIRKPKPGRTEMRFEVSRVYKGTVFRDQVVASPLGDDGCGIDPDLGSSWVIFAEERIEGTGDDAVFRLVTELCSGNLPGSRAPSVLGQGQAPMSGASDREEQAANTDATFTKVITITAGVVGVLVVLSVIGLAFLWRPGRQDS